MQSVWILEAYVDLHIHIYLYVFIIISAICAKSTKIKLA